MILKKSVERFGHECLAAEDGEEAWELFRDTEEVDVVVSDWMMPGIDGSGSAAGFGRRRATRTPSSSS
jgi:CheY-like chemotaxis protein